MKTEQSNAALVRITDLLKEADELVHQICGLLAQVGEGKVDSEKNLTRARAQYGNLSSCLIRVKRQLAEVEDEARHWRSQFLMSQIDVVSEVHRAEDAEKKLSDAILPLPYDEQRLVEERDLQWLAFTDSITQLGNSNKLDLQLKKAVDTSFETGQLSLLFIIDIDNFRTVNEFGSWSQGDEVLQDLAKRLVDNTPPGTLLTRRAEDEFAIVLTLERGELGESPLVRARQIAEFLLRILSEPLKLNNQPFKLTASIGISVCPDDADTPQEMLENAYSALMVAKSKGGNRYVIYNDSVYIAKEDRARLATELKQALDTDSIIYLFRPIVDVKTGHLAAAVVEPEWNHPAHGRLQQDQFVSLAEDHGLMPKLVEQIIGAGCELSRKTKGSTAVVLRCPQSVLTLAGFEKFFMDLVQRARIKPESLVLDIPGTTVFENKAALTRVFRELGRWGVKGSIGIEEHTPVQWSTLQSCSVSILNLSPGLMESVPAQESRRGVVQAYLDGASRLDIRILVNGVADSSQGHFLANHGCDWASGNFLSPSLHLDDFVKRRRQTWRLK